MGREVYTRNIIFLPILVHLIPPPPPPPPPHPPPPPPYPPPSLHGRYPYPRLLIDESSGPCNL